MKKRLFIFCIVFSSLALGQTNESVVPITTYGLTGDNNASISCGKFLSDDGDVYARNNWKLWISGYITGINIARGRSTPEIDVDGMYGWILNYCRANPLGALMSGASQLDKTLGVGRWPLFADKFLNKKK